MAKTIQSFDDAVAKAKQMLKEAEQNRLAFINEQYLALGKLVAQEAKARGSEQSLDELIAAWKKNVSYAKNNRNSENG